MDRTIEFRANMYHDLILKMITNHGTVAVDLDHLKFLQKEYHAVQRQFQDCPDFDKREKSEVTKQLPLFLMWIPSFLTTFFAEDVRTERILVKAREIVVALHHER
jgi:hypothetical protein